MMPLEEEGRKQRLKRQKVAGFDVWKGKKRREEHKKTQPTTKKNIFFDKIAELSLILKKKSLHKN